MDFCYWHMTTDVMLLLLRIAAALTLSILVGIMAYHLWQAHQQHKD